MNWFFIYAGGIVLLLLVELGLRLHVDKYAAPLLAWYRQAAPQGGQIKDDYFLPNSIIWRGGDYWRARPVERLVWKQREVAENPYILLPESELQTDFSAYQAADSDCLPFSGEFPLIFQTASEEEEDADFKTLEGHKIGGCPIFIQGDPFWEYHEGIDFNDPAAYSNWQKYILLLQLDSDINENDRYTGKLMWGDSGVANFFITPEDLAKRDFSRTAFIFDCH